MWETQWKLHCYPPDCSVRQKITRCKILSQKNEVQGPFGNILWGKAVGVRTSINLRCEPEKIDMMFICPPSRSARVYWVMALFTNPFSAWSIRSRHAWVCIMISRILEHDLGTGDAGRVRGKYSQIHGLFFESVLDGSIQGDFFGADCSILCELGTMDIATIWIHHKDRLTAFTTSPE